MCGDHKHLWTKTTTRYSNRDYKWEINVIDSAKEAIDVAKKELDIKKEKIIQTVKNDILDLCGINDALKSELWISISKTSDMCGKIEDAPFETLKNLKAEHDDLIEKLRRVAAHEQEEQEKKIKKSTAEATDKNIPNSSKEEEKNTSTEEKDVPMPPETEKKKRSLRGRIQSLNKNNRMS
ncbi:MAG: hypothetical protein ACD_80C00211G0006 [uncultured bacterium (gcode 4)]|uniref:Uncharacterized protein n=1 Tax=uncultured bacterium (gcode 4) TaxID=1234023 RepID=K1X3B0_9BACT|nr:MAG: hypothetical protein ACD_80C00211G0006 [uncultured bacterium (gcode 4)]